MPLPPSLPTTTTHGGESHQSFETEEDHEACHNAFFPHNAVGSRLEKNPKGTLKARSTGVNALLEGEQIRMMKGVVYFSLDSWLCVDTMLPMQLQQEAWMKKRKRICDETNLKVWWTHR